MRLWHYTKTRVQSRPNTLTLLCLVLGTPALGFGQGITTAVIRGTVRDEAGAGINGAFVRAVNSSTGHVIGVRAHGSTYSLQGLAPGGPYRIVASKLGYSPQELTGISLSLGDTKEIDFTLVSVARQLDTVRVSAKEVRQPLPAAGGVATSIPDSLLSRLPTLNRDMYDFVRLVPQVGTRFGMTGAGTSFRFNSYVIDGVSDRQLQGNNVLGGGTVGGKTISIEAVKEYQVMLSPYDARYGNFAGMLINAVTKNGTNDLHGSIYGYLRNEQIARTNSFVGSSPFRREQFGMSLGGPIIRDRLHFFVAPEFQRSESPAPGPYVGQSADASPALPVSEADVTRFAALLRARGFEPGDGGRVTSLNPAWNLFERLDLSLREWKTRVVLRDDISRVHVTRFARPDDATAFPLSSNNWSLRTAKHTSAIQIFTQASPVVFNEFLFAYMKRPIVSGGFTPSPSIQAAVVPPSDVGSVALIAGSPPNAGATGSKQLLMEFSDHVVWQVSSRHTVSIGGRAEVFRFHAEGVRGSWGQWRFSSLDALQDGDALSYSIARDFGSGKASVRGVQPGAYINDEWSVSGTLTLSAGLRADALDLFSVPAYNPVVDSTFERSTSDYPRTRVQWSPRLGFRWNPFGTQRTQLRGGAGIFVGPPPLGWLLGPVRSNGAGVRILTCSGATGGAKVPKFVAASEPQPQLCRDGSGFSNGPVALVDRDLRMAESFRTSLAIDHRLPWQIDASVEALYSRVRSDFMFVNSQLKGPQSVGAHGRVLYGTFSQTGRANPSPVSAAFPEVVDLRNHSLGHTWSLTAQLDKPFSERSSFRAGYTYSRVRDLQSITNPSAVSPFDSWASGRTLSGRHDEMSTGISSFEVPHRLVLAATYTAPWTRWRTHVSLYYIGESGSPFTFGDSTSGGLGDLNADGTSANDPIYVPLSAKDPAEIVFAGQDSVAQAEAFDEFISRTPCLNRQRGAIVARNSCRSPWVNTSSVSLRQSLQEFQGRELSLQIEIFNLLNLLRPSWGLFRTPQENILQHVGQTSGPDSQPVFHFDAANAGTSTRNLESGYQLQLSLRYSF